MKSRLLENGMMSWECRIDRDHPEADEATCQRFHAANPKRFAVGERVRVRHVLFAVTPGVDVDALRKRAEDCLLDLRARRHGEADRFIEAAARSGKVDGFAGEDSLQQPGSLYSYEEYISDLGYWQAKIHVLPEAPAGDNFREVRDASIDLGGYSVRLGLFIKF